MNKEIYEKIINRPEGKELYIDGEDLTGADFHGMNLQGITFRWCILDRAKFYGADLRFTDFSYSSLIEANLSDTLAEGASFNATKLYGASFTGADIRHADFSFVYADATYFVFTKAQGVSFRFALLLGSNFSRADLQDADFYKANLHNANLEKVNLRYAYIQRAFLRNANLREADLSNADLRGADLSNAILDEAKIENTLVFSNKLSFLKELKKPIKLYKLVDLQNRPLFFKDKGPYEIGKTYWIRKFDTDERKEQARGLYVGTAEYIRDMIMSWRALSLKVLEVEVHPKDIIAIPYSSEGAIRVKRFKVIKEIKIEDFI